MTSHPAHPKNAGHWWLTTIPAWRRLHAIPRKSITDEEMEDALDDEPWLTRQSACGITARYTMPGPFSRMGMPRCAHCCTRIGIPRGNGTPANEGAVERMLAESEGEKK